MSTVELAGSVSMNVIVPVGLDPPERVALSLSVTTGSERVTLGLAVVVRVGLAWGVSVSMSVAGVLRGGGAVPPAGGGTPGGGGGETGAHRGFLGEAGRRVVAL